MLSPYTAAEASLSARTMRAVEAASRHQFNLGLEWLDASGDPFATVPDDSLLSLGPIRVTVRDALAEANRWGEPFIFFLCPGLIAWVIPMCNAYDLAGGILSGGILLDESDRPEVREFLITAGMREAAAASLAQELPLWPNGRARQASVSLYRVFYQRSGWTPLELLHRRENASQQRQIAEAIHLLKDVSSHRYPIDEERRLLAMIRIGDRNGARGVLNQLLAALFLHASSFAVLRSRTVELMGYLVRAAIEDNPLLEPMLEQSQNWIERLHSASDFDQICVALRDALDSFLDRVVGRTSTHSNPAADRALDYLASHYTEQVNLADVAQAAGISVYRLAHLIKETTGRTVMQQVRVLRIAKAHELLEKSSLTGAEIATELGFHDQSHFIREFRLATGTTPLRYREGYRASLGVALSGV